MGDGVWDLKIFEIFYNICSRSSSVVECLVIKSGGVVCVCNMWGEWVLGVELEDDDDVVGWMLCEDVKM